MKTPALLALTLASSVLAAACSQTTVETSGGDTDTTSLTPPAAWHRTLRGALNQDTLATTVDRDGNVIITGYSEALSDLGEGYTPGNGTQDLFVSSFTPDGSVRFVRRFAGESVACLDVKTDAAGNIVLVGSYSRGALVLGQPMEAGSSETRGFVAKLDPGGEPLWAHDYASPEGFAIAGAVAIRPDGEIVVAGNRAEDLFVQDLSPSGEVLFDHSPGKMNSISWPGSAVAAMAIDAGGDLFVTGSYGGKASLGPLVDEGNTLDLGFVAKLSGKDATPIWAWSFGGPDTYVNGGSAVFVDASGDVFVSGDSLGELYPGVSMEWGFSFLVKLDGATGKPAWATSFGVEKGGALAGVGPSGNPVALATSSDAWTLGDTPVAAGTALLQFDGVTGEVLRVRHVADGAGSDAGGTMSVGPSGEIVLTNTFFDPMDSPFGKLTSEGWGDVLVNAIGVW